jgi:hypothetical protein
MGRRHATITFMNNLDMPAESFMWHDSFDSHPNTDPDTEQMMMAKVVKWG